MKIENSWYKYRTKLNRALESVNTEEITKACCYMWYAHQIYTAGNGGSAAIANHLCCDVSKGCQPDTYIATHSLVANPSVLTAIGNDIGYDETISYQLNSLPCHGNTLVLISSSGRSPNIVKAARKAKEKGMWLIGLTGFDGGELRQLADAKIHVDSFSYGIVEDCHQAVMHLISRRLKGHKFQ